MHPKFQTPWKSTIAIGLFVGVLAGLLPIDVAAPHEHRHAVRVCDRMRGGADYAKDESSGGTAVRCPMVPLVPILGIAMCLLLISRRQQIGYAYLAGSGWAW